MNVAICFNQVPAEQFRGEADDSIAEKGAELEAHAVAEALRTLGHQPQLVPLPADIGQFIAELRRLKIEIVFNLCEGHWGDSHKELHIAALFELLNISYTGSRPLCLGLTQDKFRTKEILAHHHLPTPHSCLAKYGRKYPDLKDVIYPAIVKPRFEDASMGITGDSIVGNRKELESRIKYVHETYRQGALIEEYIEGRELNIAVIGNGPCEVLPASEIKFHPDLAFPIVSYEAKWMTSSLGYKGTEPVCPARLKSREVLALNDVALRAYKLLECRDYARVDIRLRNGTPYILEVNANPDISPDAGLARSARAAGMDYPKMVGRILAMAVQRKESAHA